MRTMWKADAILIYISCDRPAAASSHLWLTDAETTCIQYWTSLPVCYGAIQVHRLPEILPGCRSPTGQRADRLELRPLRQFEHDTKASLLVDEQPRSRVAHRRYPSQQHRVPRHLLVHSEGWVKDEFLTEWVGTNVEQGTKLNQTT